MSCQHHQSPEEIEAQRRMLNEFLGQAKPRFPNGRLNPDDQGELAFAVATDHNKNVVVVRFTKAVDWLGLDKNSTRQFAKLLMEHADELP